MFSKLPLVLSTLMLITYSGVKNQGQRSLSNREKIVNTALITSAILSASSFIYFSIKTFRSKSKQPIKYNNLCELNTKLYQEIIQTKDKTKITPMLIKCIRNCESFTLHDDKHYFFTSEIMSLFISINTQLMTTVIVETNRINTVLSDYIDLCKNIHPNISEIDIVNVFYSHLMSIIFLNCIKKKQTILHFKSKKLYEWAMQTLPTYPLNHTMCMLRTLSLCVQAGNIVQSYNDIKMEDTQVLMSNLI